MLFSADFSLIVESEKTGFLKFEERENFEKIENFYISNQYTKAFLKRQSGP